MKNLPENRYGQVWAGVGNSPILPRLPMPIPEHFKAMTFYYCPKSLGNTLGNVGKNEFAQACPPPAQAYFAEVWATQPLDIQRFTNFAQTAHTSPLYRGGNREGVLGICYARARQRGRVRARRRKGANYERRQGFVFAIGR